MKNISVAKKIVAALELAPHDTVIEIGPGHGELTKELISNFQFSIFKDSAATTKLIAIEKDGVLAEELAKSLRCQILDFRKNGLEKTFLSENILVVAGDALKILPPLVGFLNLKTVNCKLKIVGNIPYYITGHLLRTIGELTEKPSLSVLMVQEEVAERIVATPPRMNRLAASVQFWANPKILARIPKNDFMPPPDVDSAVIELKTKDKKQKIEDAKYYGAVRALFQQPRKTILNNLVATTKATKEVFEKNLIQMGIPPKNRPQNLSIEDIVRIAQFFASQKPTKS